MSTGTPVVVSRIQNRRGTQQQFDGYVYSAPGPNSVYPAGYTGIGGYGSFPDFTEVNYPNVLMPGELALCTDSRKMFVGNLNGEFTEVLIGDQITDLTKLKPEPIILPPTILPPVSTTPPYVSPPPPYPWVKIDQLSVGSSVGSFIPTSFLSFLYSVTDNTTGDPRSVGVNFAKNGELTLTALSSPNVTLTDTGTDINMAPSVVSPIPVDPNPPSGPLVFPSGPPDINFKAVYEGNFITIWYMHDFPGNLILGIDSITWISLV